MTRVPSSGPKPAPISIVGEAPGRDEVHQRRPFVGVSGQLLRNVIADAKINLANIFITNLCPYQPPGNQMKAWAPIKKGKVIPNEKVMHGWRELILDLAEADSNVIVPLGNYALWALTGHQAITKRRGSIMPVTLDLERAQLFAAHGLLDDELAAAWARIEGRKVIPTIHPAAVLRQYQMLVFLATDFKRIATDAKFSDLRLPEREYYIDPDPTTLARCLDALNKGDLLSYDIECVQQKLYCVGFSTDPSWALILTTRDAGRMAVAKALLANPTPKLAQNGIFDQSFLLKNNGIRVENYREDTMVAQHVAYPELRKGLDVIASVYTREPYYKDEGKVWKTGGKDEADILQFLRYNGKDVCTTLEAFQAMQSDELTNPRHRTLYDRLMTSDIPIYVNMIVNGIKVDVAEMERQKEETQGEADAEYEALDIFVMESLIDIVKTTPQREPEIREFTARLAKRVQKGEPAINVNGRKDLLEYLYGIRKFKEKRNRKTKALSADEDSLRELYNETGDESLLLIISIRQKLKRISSYLKVKCDGKGYTYFSYNPVRTETGRSACSKTIEGYGINMQTVPHELRSMYVAERGYEFAYLDYSQAEARIVAYQAGIKAMIECFEAGQDVHRLTATKVLDIDWDDVEEYPHRYLAKRCNHAFNYEMGPEKFYKILARDAGKPGVPRITRKLAKVMRAAHMAAYPELESYWEWITSEIRKNGKLVNAFGRERIFFGRMNKETFREGYSHFAQSAVADMIRIGMRRVEDGIFSELRASGHNSSRIVLENHDALLLQYPTELRSEVIPKAMELMTVPVPLETHNVIIPVDAAYGPNYGELEKYG